MPEEIKKEESSNDKHEEIKKLLEENLELSKEIYTMTKNIKSFVTFQKIMSFIYFLLIVVPIVLSIFFLPPLLKNLFGQYQDILGGSVLEDGATQDLFKAVNPGDIKNLSPELLKLLQ